MHKLRKYLTAAAITIGIGVTATPTVEAAPRYCEVKHGQIINRPPADVGICYGTIFVRGYNVPWWW